MLTFDLGERRGFAIGPSQAKRTVRLQVNIDQARIERGVRNEFGRSEDASASCAEFGRLLTGLRATPDDPARALEVA